MLYSNLGWVEAAIPVLEVASADDKLMREIQAKKLEQHDQE